MGWLTDLLTAGPIATTKVWAKAKTERIAERTLKSTSRHCWPCWAPTWTLSGRPSNGKLRLRPKLSPSPSVRTPDASFTWTRRNGKSNRHRLDLAGFGQPASDAGRSSAIGQSEA
jgi:hypothetical protein